MVSFKCEICGKEVTFKKEPKHHLCLSCLRSINAKKQHAAMSPEEKEKWREKVAKRTKEAMNKLPPEKKKEMKRKQSEALKKIAPIITAKRIQTFKNKTQEELLEWRKHISEGIRQHYEKYGPWNLSQKAISVKNKAVPENKWFIRGKHSSKEVITVVCDECGKPFQALRANLAKQEELHPGKIYCKNCKVKGERNGNYIDGRSKYKAGYTPLFYDKNIREQIRKKQNNICPICGNELDKSAHLHHIDYNKKNDSIENLIFLHRNCHTRTNSNRDFWPVFFENYSKSYYEPLDIPIEHLRKYFQDFPLINHKVPKEFILNKLQTRRKFNPNQPPNTKGQNLSKLLSKKYFYSRKRKRNHSIVDILQSDKIFSVYQPGFSLAQIVREITSKLYAYPVSLFSHHLMDWILSKWSKNGEVVYDPAGGFGGRLIGTYYHNIKYITTDPFTYDDLDYIAEFLDLDVIINNKRSEEIKIECNLVVACPPYYNDENYGEIETRSYKDWLEQYWLKTIDNIISKKFVLILSEKYPEMIDVVSTKWKEKDRFVIINRSFKSTNREFIIYFEA